MSASMHVAQIPPGSVLLLSGVEIEPEMFGPLLEEIHQAVGHSQFVVVLANDGGDLEVFGSDDGDALAARVHQLIADARSVT